MKQNEYNNNDSTLAEFGTNIFRQNIDILRSWRKTLWNSNFKGTSAFLITDLDGIYEMLEDLTDFKQHTPNEVYEEFVKEYDMTMFLLQKCLIKSVNHNILPAGEAEQLQIKELISKIEISQQNKTNMESILISLRAEDPTVQKTLEGLGLPQEQIKKIIASGYTIESVLDVKYIPETRRCNK